MELELCFAFRSSVDSEMFSMICGGKKITTNYLQHTLSLSVTLSIFMWCFSSAFQETSFFVYQHLFNVSDDSSTGFLCAASSGVMWRPCYCRKNFSVYKLIFTFVREGEGERKGERSPATFHFHSAGVDGGHGLCSGRRQLASHGCRNVYKGWGKSLVSQSSLRRTFSRHWFFHIIGLYEPSRSYVGRWWPIILHLIYS